ncbi:hypothetical protein CDCA_CDCA15G4109 [Cyanidium caldarium]|uniref:Chloride channel protein n=1 Tax=Cyanidium caldarium TaxID=2771 RepID=A0AAV9J197_CYACA|nr:hypothetical protein CDCA_CDCA15G4109 [Cyanidium caldarium]
MFVFAANWRRRRVRRLHASVRWRRQLCRRPAALPSLSMSTSNGWWRGFETLRRQVPSSVTVLLVAAATGACTGAVVALFKTSMGATSDFLYGDAFSGRLSPLLGPLNLVVVPTVGGLAVSALRWRFGQFQGGIDQGLAAIEKREPLDVGKPVVKTAAAVATLGTGCSLGPEGPAVEIGASVGRSLPEALERWLALRLPVDRLKLLFACGAAAGVAAGFNAPFAGVFFALEVVPWGERGFGTLASSTEAASILLACSMSALLVRAGLGEVPALALPLYDLRSPLIELPLYLALGVLAGGASVGFKWMLQQGQRVFAGGPLSRVPLRMRPVVGGVVNGVVALAFPQVLFFGYDVLNALLADAQFSVPLLASLLLLKPLMTSFSLGSGLVGGTFAPALFVGANLGALYCKLVEGLGTWLISFVFKTLGSAPAAWITDTLPIAGPPAYAMIGMAAVLAGTFRAPLTASLLLFELTRDYRIILPLMAAAGISSWLVEASSSESTAGAAPSREERPSLLYLGLRPESEFRHVALSLRVRDALCATPPLMVDGDCSAVQVIEQMREARHRYALVLSSGSVALEGIITLHDLLRERNARGALREQSVIHLCTTPVLYVHEDDTLATALDLLRQRGFRQLPVLRVRSAEVAQDRVIGVVDLDSIARSVALSELQREKAPLATTDE